MAGRGLFPLLPPDISGASGKPSSTYGSMSLYSNAVTQFLPQGGSGCNPQGQHDAQRAFRLWRLLSNGTPSTDTWPVGNRAGFQMQVRSPARPSSVMAPRPEPARLLTAARHGAGPRAGRVLSPADPTSQERFAATVNGPGFLQVPGF